MDIRTRSLLKKYTLQYIESITDKKIGKRNKVFQCPVCKIEEDSASINPPDSGKMVCYNPSCNFSGEIFEIVKKAENMPNWSENDVKAYLTKLFKIKLPEQNYKELDLYFKNDWYLFPVVQDKSKAPIKGFSWTTDCTNNRKIWKDWIDRGWGLGLVLGKKSKVIALDIDDDGTYQQIKHLLPKTLIQTTKRGNHFLFNYEEDFHFLKHSNLRNKGYEMEVRANNAYIVVAPTCCEGEIREWNNEPIINMPKELKSFLLELIDKDVDSKKDEDDDIQNCIDNENIGTVDLSGRRNDMFVRMAGVFSKWVDQETNFKILNFLSNNVFDKPIPRHELNASLEQIKKYRRYDKEEFATMVLDRLKVIKEATAYQIASSLKKDVKDVEDILKHLEDKQEVIDMGNRKYKALNKVEWTTDVSNISTPIDYEMPYFHEYTYLDKGNMIIIAAPPGSGKTHIVGNIILKLVEQNINPDLINTEAGSKIGKVTTFLGVKQNTYAMPVEPVKHPSDIELRDNKVTIIDWLKPIGGDWSKTEHTFDHFNNQLQKHSGNLIIMTQLRKDTNEYFAKDIFDFYAALVAKYLYTKSADGRKDNINTYFEVTKNRDSKIGKTHIIVPTHFDPDTKILNLRK